MIGQGRYLSVESIFKIIHLLASTEMNMSEIAERMSLSRTTVALINRKYRVRQYRLRASGSKAEIDKVEQCSPQPLAKKKSA